MQKILSVVFFFFLISPKDDAEVAGARCTVEKQFSRDIGVFEHEIQFCKKTQLESTITYLSTGLSLRDCEHQEINKERGSGIHTSKKYIQWRYAKLQASLPNSCQAE